MITNKILLIEIALVVITTICHTYADNRAQLCENLINELELFDEGEEEGLSNFMDKFKHYSNEDIQEAVDMIPDNSGNASMRIMQTQLTIDYSMCLLKTINEIYEDLDFQHPEFWCRERVLEYRAYNILDPNDPLEDEVRDCNGSIFEHLNTDLNVLNGKFAIFKAFYEHFSYMLILDMMQNRPSFNILHYTLGYFNHLVDFVNSPGHLQYSNQFKSIKQFCTDEGYKLLPSKD